MRLRQIKQALQSTFDRPFNVNKKTKHDSEIFLPTELWHEILSHVASESIASISLTCRSLRWIAQPLLFQNDLTIHPFLSSISYRGLKVDSYVLRCHERLDFISSPRIACQIRSFSLTPYPKGHSLSRSAKAHTPENYIVDRVFGILPLFTNLQRLVLHAIKSTPGRMEVLQNLSLNHFELETRGDDITWMKMPQEDTPPSPIPARRVFSFNCNTSPRQIPMPFLVPLQFIHPSTLEEVCSGLNGTESILLAMSLSSSVFHRLQTLDLSVRFVSSPQFVPALRQCPNLSTLRLRSAFTDSPARPTMAPVPPDILQGLLAYHGPPSLAVAFAQDRMIRHFKLWSSRRASSVTQPAKLAPLILQLGPYVESLEIGVTTLPPFLIEVIADRLPNLKSLSVNGHLSSYHPGVATTHIIQTRFNPSIRIAQTGTSLNLDVLSFGVQIPNTVAEETPEHEKVVLDLLERFPGDYNPTSWDQWAIDLAWSRLIWNRLDTNDRRQDGPGKLSIEHVEYLKPLF